MPKNQTVTGKGGTNKGTVLCLKTYFLNLEIFMRNESVHPFRKKLLSALWIFLAALLVIGVWQRRAVRAVWCNLTAKKLSLDERERDDWNGGESYLKVPYASDSQSQYLDLYVPDADAVSSVPKLLVIIHGGGFIYNDSQSRQAQLMYRYFRDHGFACASINYRLAQEAPFPAAIADCKAAIRFLRAHAGEYGYDAEKIAVFGESAGGYLATMCAVTPEEQFSDVQFLSTDEAVGGAEAAVQDATAGTALDASAAPGTASDAASAAPGTAPDTPAAAPAVSAKVDVLVDYYGHIDNEGADADWAELAIPKVVRTIANAWVNGEVLQGYADVESFWARKNISEMTQDEKKMMDPHAWIDKNSAGLSGMRAWIIHGDADITVPYLHSSRLTAHLVQKIGQENVTYTLVPGMGHAADMLYSEEVLAGLEKYLKVAL